MGITSNSILVLCNIYFCMPTTQNYTKIFWERNAIFICFANTASKQNIYLPKWNLPCCWHSHFSALRLRLNMPFGHRFPTSIRFESKYETCCKSESFIEFVHIGSWYVREFKYIILNMLENTPILTFWIFS